MNNEFWNPLLDQMTDQERGETLPHIREIEEERADGVYHKMMLVMRAHIAATTLPLREIATQTNDTTTILSRLNRRFERLRFFRIWVVLILMLASAGLTAGAIYLLKGKEFKEGQEAVAAFDHLNSDGIRIHCEDLGNNVRVTVEGAAPALSTQRLPVGTDPTTGKAPPIQGVTFVFQKETP
jgi:hypothetical protein